MKSNRQDLQAQNKEYWKLIVSVALDCFGFLSYLILGFGESTDIFWAPISAFFCFLLYRGKVGALGGIVTFGEEILPFTDFIPSLTVVWLIKYDLLKSKQTEILS